jgi:hypothetical protein
VELNYEITHVIINSAASTPPWFSFYIDILPRLTILHIATNREQNAHTIIDSSTNCL